MGKSLQESKVSRPPPHGNPGPFSQKDLQRSGYSKTVRRRPGPGEGRDGFAGDRRSDMEDRGWREVESGRWKLLGKGNGSGKPAKRSGIGSPADVLPPEIRWGHDE